MIAFKSTVSPNECPACYSKQIDNNIHFFSRIPFHPTVGQLLFMGAQCQKCGHFIERRKVTWFDMIDIQIEDLTDYCQVMGDYKTKQEFLASGVY